MREVNNEVEREGGNNEVEREGGGGYEEEVMAVAIHLIHSIHHRASIHVF